MTIEAETVLQLSLHTIPEYVGLVLDEAESRGVDVASLRTEYDKLNKRKTGTDPWWIGEIADDALGLIANAGYPCVEENDILLIWPKGTEVPEE